MKLGLGLGLDYIIQMNASKGVFNPFEDATVAYSLRDLNLGVTSNVVRVRRSSDNLEQDFTATQITDGSLTTFCGAGDGFVTVWYNQKGNNNATQTSASIQPKIVSLGSLVVNSKGQPTIDFTELTSGNVFLEFNPWHVATSTFIEAIYVYEYLETNNVQYLLGSNPVDNGLIIINSSSTARSGILRTSGLIVFNSQTVAANNLYLRSLKANQVNLINQINNNTGTAANDNTSDIVIPDKYYIGSGASPAIESKVKVNECIFLLSNIGEGIKENINNHYAIY